MEEGATSRLRAAIGRNADYYLTRWRAMDATGRTASWNWAACLLNLYWLAWRKMWAALAVFILANIVLGVLGALMPALGRFVHLPLVALGLAVGAWGNWAYRRKVDRLVADADADEAALRRRGGTSPTALGVAIALTVALAALIVLALLQAAPAA